jgi:elongation factor P
MASYNTSDLKKGLKVQIDGVPFLIVEMNFKKPGKGQAVYTCRMLNLIRGTTLERNYRSGDSLDAADVHEEDMQYLYRDGDNFVFMDPVSFEQPSIPKEIIGDKAQWLKDNVVCRVMFFNDKAITVEPPAQMVLKVEYTEPGARGNTATNVLKEAKLETGAIVKVPIFIETGEMIKVDTATNGYIERVREK